MKPISAQPKALYIYLLAWTILNMLQSAFLDITPDEAYYWMWSKHLSWGYLDHPPMVAWLIKPGYTLIRNELGVRLLFILISTGSLYLLYRIVSPKNFAVFFLVTVSCLPLHLSGFHALPDVPLIFFSLLFLFVLQRYLKEDSLLYGASLGFIAAAILYSKYHGIFFLLPIVFALPRLWKRKSFWLAILIAAVCMVPHVLWQFENDFASLQFHLYERSWWKEPYSFKSTLKYLWVQPLILGPPVAILMAIALFKSSYKQAFDRSLIVLTAFIYLFFFVATFRGGPVHPHWTDLAAPPLLILTIKFFDSNWDKYRKWVLIAAIPSILVFGFGRSILFFDYLPESLTRDLNHNWEDWAEEIKEMSDCRPVVFLNDLQEAARYEFYTGDKTLCVGNIYDRRSQYDLWPKDDRFFGKDVFVLSTSPAGLENTAQKIGITGYDSYSYFEVNNFVYFPLIQIQTNKSRYKVQKGGSSKMTVRVLNEDYNEGELDQNPQAIPKLGYQIFEYGATVIEIRTDYKIIDIQNSELDLPILLPEEPGKYKMKFCVYTGQIPPTQNSKVIDLVVR
jgi:hypothetical protein